MLTSKFMGFSDSYFARHFGITQQDLERYLGTALSLGGDFADLYFEYLQTTSLTLEESLIKSATQGTSLGVGVRVVAGDRTGYAYTDDLDPKRILEAARVAARIAQAQPATPVADLRIRRGHDLYPVEVPPSTVPLAQKVNLLIRANEAAFQFDPRVFLVQVSYVDSVKEMLVAASDGTLAWDTQPMVRLNVVVLAREAGGPPQRGYAGGGGRMGLEFFETRKTPEEFAREAARQAVVQLEAVEAPAGELTVVLGPGWPGILLHEAVGHGLEADFNRKGVSAFTGRIGQQVASPLVTVIDDGTIPHRRGSINIDDEGTPTSRTVLIENGILRGYLFDKLSARLMNAAPTGNGRRESYQHPPIPRMTNTYMLAGDMDPEEIIRSVKWGLYCASFGGGQVDITSGNFVFSATECYLIEDGKLGRPVRGASLIGNGPSILHHVTMVGNDLQLDDGVGVCGKEGQHVPVGVGLPTVRLDRITVGGTVR